MTLYSFYIHDRNRLYLNEGYWVDQNGYCGYYSIKITEKHWKANKL